MTNMSAITIFIIIATIVVIITMTIIVIIIVTIVNNNIIIIIISVIIMIIIISNLQFSHLICTILKYQCKIKILILCVLRIVSPYSKAIYSEKDEGD